MAWTFGYLKDEDNMAKYADAYIDPLEYTEDSDYPLSNILSLPVSKAARLTPLAASSSILLSVPSVGDVTVLALIGHNLSSSATVTIYAGSDYTTTTDLGSMTWRKGLMLKVFSAAENYAFWRIYITDDSNEYGYHQIGYIVLGALSNLSFGYYDYAFSDEFNTLGGGKVNSDRKVLSFTQNLSVRFRNRPVSDSATIRTLFRDTFGSSKPVLIVPNTNSNEAVFGRFQDTLVISRVSSGASPKADFDMTIRGDSMSECLVEDTPYYLGGEALDSDWTFTRNSTAYYKNANLQLVQKSANEARTNHYVEYGVAGLLLEPASTNIFANSETMSGMGYTRASGQLGAYAEPKATPTTAALRVMEDTSTGTHYVTYTTTFTAGSVLSFSFFIKPNGREVLYIYFLATEYFGLRVNITLGAHLGAYTSGGIRLGYRIEKYYNGWYRIQFSGTVGASRTIGNLVFLPVDSGGFSNYTGDGSSGFYLWGLQFEEGIRFPTSYIATSGASASRSGDDLSLAWNHGILPATFYVDTVDVGGNLTVSGRYVTLGYDTEEVFRLYTISGSVATCLEFDSGTPENSVTSNGITIGTNIEALGRIYQGFSHSSSLSVAGAAQLDGTETSALAYDGQLVNSLYVNRGAASETDGKSPVLYKSIKTHRGAQTLDFMRKL